MLPLTVVSMFVPPSIVNVSPFAIASVVPESAATLNPAVIATTLTPVTKPFALTVNTGIAVPLPYAPTSVLTVANVLAIDAVSPAPVNVAVPVESPVNATVTALVKFVAKLAVPVKLPVTSPVTSPVKLPVTLPVCTPALLPVKAPVTSPVTSPVKAPTNDEFAVIVEPVIAAALLAPIIVPSIAPPSMSTALAACTANVPNPKFVLAPDAAVAPVPPFATPKAPVTKLLSLMSIAPAVTVPLETCIVPVLDERSKPVPPYAVPIAEPVHVPDVTLPKRISSKVVPSDCVRSKRLLLESYLRRPPLLPI